MTADAETLKPDESVEIHCLDVGQGDCTVVIDRRSNRAVVIDCPGRVAPSVIARVRELGNPTADTLIISHWDFDHYGGALELASALRCTTLVLNRDTMMAHPIDRTLRRAQLRRLREEPFRSMRRRPGTEGASGQVGAAVWAILAPSEIELDEAVTELDRNLSSTIVRVSAHGRSIIVAADSDTRPWKRLIECGVALESDVLRWPHHGGSLRGGAGVTAKEILDAVQPEYVVVSVGSTNSYGHPDETTLREIAGRCRVACTEVTGQCVGPSRPTEATPCGGNLGFRITQDCILTPLSGWAAHDSVVAGWSSPMCLGEVASE